MKFTFDTDNATTRRVLWVILFIILASIIFHLGEWFGMHRAFHRGYGHQMMQGYGGDGWGGGGNMMYTTGSAQLAPQGVRMVRFNGGGADQSGSVTVSADGSDWQQ